MTDSPISHRTFVSYIDRTREFYGAQGYAKPYRWAHFAEVPFAPLPRPLSECRVTLVTTASPWHTQPAKDGVLRGAKEVWSGPTAEPPERLYTDDLAWDKEATHTDDVESFLPLRQLRHFVEAGRIGSVAERFHGVPTDYSQRRTREGDAPEILARCREDGVDVALLVPL
jgi:D-proline reductase (dithiol) PrdB